MNDAAPFCLARAERRSPILVRPGHILATIRWAERVMILVAQHVPIVVLPHPTRKNASKKHGIQLDLRRQARVISAVGYLDALLLERNAAVIVTDSGGVQGETSFHRMPRVTLRAETEWVWLVELRCSYLSSPYGPQ